MTNSSTSDDWPKNAMPAKLVEWLFDKMLSKWGRQFIDKWAMIDPKHMKREWAKALYGMTEIEFRRGVAKMDTFDRPPSQPEFLKACRPEINPVNAYWEAVEGSRRRERGEVGTWSHPAIFWASVRVSAFELKNQPYANIRARWEAALASEFAKKQWDEIPVPMIALPAPGKGKVSSESAVKMIAEIKALTSSKMSSGSKNDKRWARKILERLKHGDKTLTLVQIEFAQHALKNLED